MKKLQRTGIALLLILGMFFSSILPSVTVRAEDQSITPQAETASDENVSDSLGKLNYLYIDKPYMEEPGEQNIVVSFGNGTEAVTAMTALLQKENGDSFEAVLDRKEAETYLLKYTFQPGDEGIYHITELRYTMNEQPYTLDLPSIGLDTVFGIGEKYTGYNEDTPVVTSAGVVDGDVSMSILQAEEGQGVTSDDIEAAISASDVGEPIESFSDQRNITSDELVVVIDPGHGGSEPGAVHNGITEKDFNLKIARYCKEELEQYSNVRVYMTREDDRYLGLSERVDIAASYNADLFLCIHLNASEYSSARGAEVYYPNANYNSTIYQNGKNTAQLILNQLVALGLENRGIFIRDTTLDERYPDGSLSDYYTVINESKRAGFPGLIVEHAFLSNPSEAERLKQDSFLKKLGVADATGVANAYGLTKGPSGPPAIAIENINQLTGKARIRFTNAGSGADVAIWSEVNGQDDLVWYHFSGNSATLDFDMYNHKNSTGTYQVHMYSRNADGSAGQMLASTNFSMTLPPMRYSDVPSDAWFCDTVKAAYERGLMTGMNATTFAPNTLLTRGMVATILWRLEGEPQVEYSQVFPDLEKGIFYTTPILWANQSGVMTGYADGRCGANDNITREQFSTMMFRYAETLNLDTTQREDLSTFPDGMNTSDFAKNAVEWTVGNKIISGNADGTLAPQDFTSRAVAATILIRFINVYNL